MPFIPVAATAMVEFIYTSISGVSENTLYFRRVDLGSPSEEAMGDLCAGLQAWWLTHLEAIQPVSYTLTEIVATNLETATSPAVAFPVGFPGIDTGSALPSQDTLCISFRTNQRGRSYRGRNYVIGLQENQVVFDTVDLAVATAWVDAYADLPTFLPGGLGAPEWTWVVVSRFTNGEPREFGIATPIFEVQVVNRFIDSQNRRLEAHGE